MKLHYVALSAFFVAPFLHAEGIQVKAKVIGSEGRLSIDGAEASLGPVKWDVGSLRSEDSSRQTATGFGAALEFPLGDPLRIGVETSYVPFKNDSGDEVYTDLAWGGYASVDFLRQDLFSVYGTGGLGFHQLHLADRSFLGSRVKYKDTGLLNYELGLGTRVKLSQSMDFALELHRSDTFSRNDIDVSVEGMNLAGAGLTYKNVGLAKNEAVASLNFGF